MASYFVARHAPPHEAHAVHDRSLCPPTCFTVTGATEYLGDFLEAAQALAVARLRYAQVQGCACCEAVALPARAVPVASPARGTVLTLRS